MNDRFKFRIWDKEDCSYFEPRDFDDLWLNENAELRVGFYSDATQMIEDYTDNVIIEQCTGLKDKNGNLIYEGDVVKIGNGSVNGEVIESEIEVEWIDNAGRYNLPTWTSDTPDWSHYVEVIGNIHEQAEQKDK